MTVCTSKTRNIAEITKSADILIVAIGKPGYITRDMVQAGAIVVDVGCTFINGFARGDVDFDSLCETTEFISPVPGGVGPMTVAMVIENTWKAFELQNPKNIHIKNNVISFRYP